MKLSPPWVEKRKDADGNSRLSFRTRLLLFLVLFLVAVLWCAFRSFGTPVTVNWNVTHQTIDGFGASATGYVSGLSPRQIDQFFDPDRGLGLSLLRIHVIADIKDADCDCVANSAPARCARGSDSQIVSGDLEVAQSASSRGVRLIAAPWSPPAEMKSSGKFCSDGLMNGGTENYARYAGQLVDFLSFLKQKGISIDAISVQNEPDEQNSSYDTAKWTGKQIHDFVPILSQAMSKANLEEVKIAAPEQEAWKFDLMDDSMSDPDVVDKIGIVFGHAYTSENPSGLPSVGTRHIWQTEVSDFTTFDGSIADGLRWGSSIHNYMLAGVNAWMYWNIDCATAKFNHGNNMCLTDSDENLAKRAYVLGQFAKFVRPGWQRIDVTYNGPLLVTAFKGPKGDFAIVAINKGRLPIFNQSFRIDGTTSRHSEVLPWVTTSSQSLAAQQPLEPDSNGSAFTYTIPGRSVVTFQGKGD